MTRTLVFCILTSLVTSQVDSTQQCRPVYSQLLRCLSLTRPTIIDITCPRATLLHDISAALYRSVNSTCPTHHQPNDCHDRTISEPIYPVNSSHRLTIHPEDLTKSTDCGGRNASRYVIVTYRCTASQNIFLNSSSVAVSLTDNSTYTGSRIIVTNRNPLSTASLGVAARGTSYCSLYVGDGHVDVEVTFSMLAQSKSMTSEKLSSCSQRAELWDGQSEPLLFCKDTEQPILLPCSGSARSFKVTYVNTDNGTAPVFFLLEIQVPRGSVIVVQCGHPPYPLFQLTEKGRSTSTTITLPKTTSCPDGNSHSFGTVVVAVVFIGIALILVVVFTILITHCCRSRRQRRSLSSESESSSVDVKDVSEKPKSTYENIYVDVDNLPKFNPANDANESKI